MSEDVRPSIGDRANPSVQWFMHLANLVRKFREMDADGKYALSLRECVNQITHGWRCFFCDEYFETKDEAAKHFGHDQSLPPICARALTKDSSNEVGK